MAAAAQRGGSGYLERPRPSGLADVIEIILDKGIVIDAYARVALIGVETLTTDARIVIASVGPYLRFAEAVNRLDIAHTDDSQGLPELMESVTEGGAKSKTQGALEGVKEKLTGDDDDDDGGEEKPKEKQKSQRRRSSSSKRSSGSPARSRSRKGS